MRVGIGIYSGGLCLRLANCSSLLELQQCMAFYFPNFRGADNASSWGK